MSTRMTKAACIVVVERKKTQRDIKLEHVEHTV